MNAELQQRFDHMIDRHFRFEAEDDVAGVLSTMADDVEHDVVGYPTGPVQGKAAARGFYDTMFNDLAGEKVTTLRRYYGPDFVVDESLWEGRATGTPFGIPCHGRRLAFRLLHVFDMAPDGQIKRENVWLDFAAILQQLHAPRDACTRERHGVRERVFRSGASMHHEAAPARKRCEMCARMHGSGAGPLLA